MEEVNNLLLQWGAALGDGGVFVLPVALTDAWNWRAATSMRQDGWGWAPQSVGFINIGQSCTQVQLRMNENGRGSSGMNADIILIGW